MLRTASLAVLALSASSIHAAPLNKRQGPTIYGDIGDASYVSCASFSFSSFLLTVS
jgi:hypothetical protein